MGNSSSSQNSQQQQRPPPRAPPPLTNSYPSQQYPPATVYNGHQGSYPPYAGGYSANNYYGGYPQAPAGQPHYPPSGPYHQAPPPPGQYPSPQPGPGGYLVPNPYAPPPKTHEYQRTATIRNQVNLKKPTLKLEKTGDNLYTLSFKFDASAACRVTTFFMAQEEPKRACKITMQHRAPAPAVFYEKGLDQSFPPTDAVVAQAHVLDLNVLSLKELMALNSTSAAAQPDQQSSNPVSTVGQAGTYAVIIRLEALTDEGRQQQRSLQGLEPGCEQPDWVQSQTTYARITQEEGTGELALRILKQKIRVKGDSYELQEIYGMERNRPAAGIAMGTPSTATGDVLEDVDGNECVICMSAPRDTAALPCRHMCMCHSCAGALKTQTNKCPICRNEIKNLLHIKINKGPEAPASTALEARA